MPDETASRSIRWSNYDMRCEISLCLVRTNNIGGHLEQTQNKRVRPVELPDLTASSLLPPLSASMRNGSSFGLSSGVVYILRLLTMYGGIAKVHHSERVHLNCAMVFSDCLDMNHQCTHVSTALLERPVPPSHQPSLPPSSKAQPSSPFGGPAFLSLRRPSLSRSVTASLALPSPVGPGVLSWILNCACLTWIALGQHDAMAA